MKTLSTFVACALVLSACVVDSELESELESEDTTQEPAPSESVGVGFGGDVECEGHVDYHHVMVDGHDYWVQVPTFCDPNPYIYKGDPGPEAGDLLEDTVNPELREKIVETLYARLAKTSRSDSAAFQWQ